MSIRRTASVALTVAGLAAISGCAEQFPATALEAKNDDLNELEQKKQKEGCRVSGKVVSTEWRALGGGIERGIVTVSKLPDLQQVDTVYAEGKPFEIYLPPGKYQMMYRRERDAQATFKIQTSEVTVAREQDILELGEIDLPISKSTGLYGKPAPELTGIIAWKNTPPMTLKDLRGKVVVLDFFAYYCSICHAHKPDLEKLRKQYERQGLVVLAIHDPSLKTLDEMNAKMDPELQRVFKGNPPQLPMALDGAGENSVFEAYGMYAVPAVILIDEEGRVVCRYHHAGKPELEADVRSLLSANSIPVQ